MSYRDWDDYRSYKYGEKEVEALSFRSDMWQKMTAQLSSTAVAKTDEIVAKEIVEPASSCTPPAFESLVHYARGKPVGKYGPDEISGSGVLPYQNIRDLMARFFLTVYFHDQKVKNWRNRCIGVTSFDVRGAFNAGADTLHLPMLDYDGKGIKRKIRKDVKLLQEDFKLGDAWVYQTRRGFHVYFFTDLVKKDTYFEILGQTGCCGGFLKATQSRGYGVLRVSAKYTEFDIKQEYILRAKNKSIRRMTRKAHVIRSLLDMGQECGTHLATLFSEQAYYTEDVKAWRPTPRTQTKRIHKVKNIPGHTVVEVKKPIRQKVGTVQWNDTTKWADQNYFTTSATTASNVSSAANDKYQAVYTKSHNYT